MAAFDPYHIWLGIPPEEQPPSLYRLLGVRNFESNADVIESAAQQRMLHLRTFQSGKYSEQSQRLLNEVAKANHVLLDAQKKAAYDRELRTKLNSDSTTAAKPAERAPVLAHPVQTPQSARPQPALPEVLAPVQAGGIPPNLMIAGAVGIMVALMAAVGVGFWLTRSPAQVAVTPPVPASQPPGSPSPPPPPTPTTSVTPQLPALPPAIPSIPPAPFNPPPQPMGGVPSTVVPPGPASDPFAPMPPLVGPMGLPGPGPNPGGFPVPPPMPIIPGTIPPESQVVPALPASPSEPRLSEIVPAATMLRGPRGMPMLLPSGELPGVAPERVAPKPRLQAPSAEERDRKRADLATIFPVEKARSAKEKQEIAARMLDAAHQAAGDAAGRFVLLDLVRELAASGGNYSLAENAIGQLERDYDVDSLALRADSLELASKAIIPVDEKREIVERGAKLIDQLIAADDFSRANALSARLASLMRDLRGPALTKYLTDQRRRLTQETPNFKKYQAALETLVATPDDPDANLLVGKRLAFARDDWGAGLPKLAKGQDPLLSAAAQSDLSAPQTFADVMTIAENWWSAANSQKEADDKEACRRRAVEWYRRILFVVDGLDKVKAESRIAEGTTKPKRPTDDSTIDPTSEFELTPRIETYFLDDYPADEARVAHTLGRKGSTGRMGNDRFQCAPPQHALSTHALASETAHVTYYLPPEGFETFEAIVGLWQDKAANSASPLTFRVVGDGKMLWESLPLSKHGSGQDCRVSIRNVRILTLQVVCPGDNTAAVALWANPRVSRTEEMPGGFGPRSEGSELGPSDFDAPVSPKSPGGRGRPFREMP